MRFVAAGLLVGVACLVGPSADPSAQEKKKSDNKPVSFANDVMPIFNNYCTSCHDTKKAKGKLDMSGYAPSAKGGKSGKLWVAGNPAKSLLITEISGDKPKMPEKGSPVSKDEIDTLTRWIKEGARNN